jgi:hypothetical protein
MIPARLCMGGWASLGGMPHMVACLSLLAPAGTASPSNFCCLHAGGTS